MSTISRFYRQGPPDGRVDHRGYPEAIFQTYGLTSTIFTIRRILNKYIEVGEFVERDEEIATIETDKVYFAS